MVPNRTDEVKTGSPHWYISYNSRDRNIYGSDTTALVLGQGEYFLILNGDHRAGLNEIIQNTEAHPKSRLHRCLDYIREHRDQLNDMSNELF